MTFKKIILAFLICLLIVDFIGCVKKKVFLDAEQKNRARLEKLESDVKAVDHKASNSERDLENLEKSKVKLLEDELGRLHKNIETLKTENKSNLEETSKKLNEALKMLGDSVKEIQIEIIKIKRKLGMK